MYGSTEFYKANTDKATFAGNWIYQINQISREFRQAQFVRITGAESQPVDWENKFNNLTEMSMDDFKVMINKL